MTNLTVQNQDSNNSLIVNGINDNSKVWGEITIADIKESNIGIENREILLARFNEKAIKDLDANMAGNRLKEIINLTIFESGFKTENISELILMVIKDIFSDFSYMTLSEVSLAFRKGIRGNLGEYMGLSVRTFYTWLKTYNETLKQKAIKSLQFINKEENKTISEDKKKEYYKKWLQSHIEDFERHKNGEEIIIYDFGNVFYDYCVKNAIGYITISEEKELRERARTNVIRKHSSFNAKSVFQAQEFKNILLAISSNNITPNIQDMINSEMKRLAIVKFFDKLIHHGLELKTFIEEIENKG